MNTGPAAVYSRPDKSMIAVSSPSSAGIVAKASVPQPTAQIHKPPSGFDWGDASIGAGLALAILGVGGALVIPHRRSRRRPARFYRADGALTACYRGQTMTAAAPPPETRRQSASAPGIAA